MLSLYYSYKKKRLCKIIVSHMEMGIHAKTEEVSAGD